MQVRLWRLWLTCRWMSWALLMAFVLGLFFAPKTEIAAWILLGTFATVLTLAAIQVTIQGIFIIKYKIKVNNF